MKKEELLKIINALPDGTDVDIDIAPSRQEEEEWKEPDIKCYQDLASSQNTLYGFMIYGPSINPDYAKSDIVAASAIFEQRCQAESALAMAQLSQVLPYYCEPFTEEELQNGLVIKYGIGAAPSRLYVYDTNLLRAFLMFRTREQAESFLKHNEQLIRQYFMMKGK